jgi:predicted dehydrogenase
VKHLKFGLIGTGFMGNAHAIALRSVGTVFDDLPAPRLHCLVDSNAETARKLALAWGFENSADDWRALCADPEIDVVDICTPNHLHLEMALAAIEAGKHVYCEKPLALSAKDARRIRDAAAASGVCTAMGFNYMCNPLITKAQQMIAAGEIGEIYSFRGSYQEDYLADPSTPFGWRLLRDQGGAGALADLGTHLINMAEYLLGPLSAVLGSLTTVHPKRRDPVTGKQRDVENEDIAQMLVKFSRGCTGTMEISRVATGKKCGLEFEIFGSQGSMAFDQERMNELRIYSNASKTDERGFRTILAGPEHPDYAAFCPAPGHGLGINDLKVIEVRNLLRGILHGEHIYSDFRNGCRVQEISDAVEASSQRAAWIDISEDTLEANGKST